MVVHEAALPLLVAEVRQVFTRAAVAAHRRRCAFEMPDMPAWTAGGMEWGARIAYLREGLRALGWISCVEGGVCGTQTADGRYQLFTLNGHWRDGKLHVRERSANSPWTAILGRNDAVVSGQLEMFLGSRPQNGSRPVLACILAVHVEGHLLHTALAIPVSQSAEGADSVFECFQLVPLDVVNLRDEVSASPLNPDPTARPPRGGPLEGAPSTAYDFDVTDRGDVVDRDVDDESE